jgi:2,3-bisphosphoglycerate-independent phosphoglycerate mutase
MVEGNPVKYVILVGDGMGDYPLEELGGRTPLEAAETPNMDRVAACRIGRVRTIPEGMPPGSDVANLSLMGYDPRRYLTGRSPLEAASMGVELAPEEVAFRMNLVTLERRVGDEAVITTHSSGDITTEEGRLLVEALRGALEDERIALHAGVAFRHLLVWKNGPQDARTIPPHDVLEQNMASYLATADRDPVVALMQRSWEVLAWHPVNEERRRKGLSPATSIWLWGQGKPPAMPSFESSYGLRGGVISAVDLIKGIGIYAGFRPIPVEGATGFLDTNYEGKVREALHGLETEDLIFLHVEAPDEAGHSGHAGTKVTAIERFDARIVGPVLEGLDALGGDYRVLVVSDHYTPIVRRTHTPEPAPFAWARKGELSEARPARPFTEAESEKGGLLFDPGHEIVEAFLGRSRSGG